MSHQPDTSAGFYRLHSSRYAEVAHSFTQSTYASSSLPWLKNDWDILRRAEAIVPEGHALDAGCGAGARDVYKLWCDGYDAWGIDAVQENVDTARRMHPEIADRVSVADLSKPLSYETGTFDLVLCNAVIQHIPAEDTFAVTFPELIRVLRPGGLLQLMFKCGEGILTLHDHDYGVDRSFILYSEQSVIGAISALGMELVETSEAPGTLLHFVDTKGAPHCAFHAIKRHSATRV